MFCVPCSGALTLCYRQWGAVEAFRVWGWYRVCILESSGKKEKPDQVEKNVVRKWILPSGAFDDTHLKSLWTSGGAASSWPPSSVGQWGLRKYRACGGQCSFLPK